MTSPVRHQDAGPGGGMKRRGWARELRQEELDEVCETPYVHWECAGHDAETDVCARPAERGWHGATRVPGEEQPCVVWCMQGRVPREPSDLQTPPGAPPHRGAGWRTSHAREEDVMDHPDDP